MQVLFDHQIFLAQRYGGISRYFVRLSEQLLEMGVDVHVVSALYQNKYLKDLPAWRVRGLEIPRLPPKTGRIFRMLNEYAGPILSRKFTADIIHETYYSPKPTIKGGRASRVLTVYDMIHEKFAGEFPAKDKTTGFKKSAIERAQHIICISQSTKNDLCEIFDVPIEKVTVVHLGVDVSDNDLGSNVFEYEKPFVLYVGARKAYKNFENFIKAFALNERLCNEMNVIAFGGGPFNGREVDLIRSVGLGAEAVHQVSGDDSVLNTLYKKAVAFVYPSLYEGFGLPPLEAMAQGCPVAASNTSSMPEVIGNAAEYFNPTEPEAIAKAVERVVYDSARRLELTRAGSQRVKEFTWRSCAEKTRDVYKSVIDTKSV